MPRTTKRQLVLGRLDDLSKAAIKHSNTLKLLGVPSDEPDTLLCHLFELKCRVSSNRYLHRAPYRKRTPKWHVYLDQDHGDAINDREFKTFFRMSRDSFKELVAVLDSHRSFHRKTSDTRGQNPQPCEHQPLVLLRYYGCEGNAASSVSLGMFFGVSSGSIDSYREGALEALLSIEDMTYFWPDAKERKQIAKRIQDDYLFPHCVGVIDGTLLPLSSRPHVHGQTYMSRKRFYAVVMLIVCDDLGRILYYHIGWPGSVHDNRVWRNSNLFLKCNEFFSPKEYLLGDTAFTASAIMVPPYKSLPGNALTGNKTEFNTLLARPRVKSEHCIGIFKGRLPFFKSIRLQLSGKASMKRLVDYVRGGVVLHNFLIGEDVEDDWIDDDDLEEDDLGPEVDSMTNQPDYTRREELYYYLSELDETNIN